MTMPTDGPGGPGGPDGPDSWMTISDVFYIPGRGTVVTGQLEGNVPLNVGDVLVGPGGKWQISGIEQFRAMLTTAEPGSNIGINPSGINERNSRAGSSNATHHRTRLRHCQLKRLSALL